MKWRFIDTGPADAAANMAIDEAIMLAHGAGEAPPTLRVYGWRPPAVSIGYFQRATDEIDVAECRRLGIDVVRRLTGGRAVLHDAELTYSLVISAADPAVPQTITASYRYFSEGLLAALAKLGVAAQMSMPRAAYGQRVKASGGSAACFDAPSHYEIIHQGRKLVGSAQVRKNGVILQHGSILLSFNAGLVAAVLQQPSAELRQAMAGMLAAKATSLEEILGRAVTWREAADALAAAFGPALGLDLEQDELTAEEVAAAGSLATEKYGHDGWNMMR